LQKELTNLSLDSVNEHPSSTWKKIKSPSPKKKQKSPCKDKIKRNSPIKILIEKDQKLAKKQSDDEL